MIRKGCGALAIVILVVVLAAWTYARIDETCFAAGDAAEVRADATGFAIDGRSYHVSAYAPADYGAYLFPGGLFRGHPVRVAIDLSAADDARMPEVQPQCIRVDHEGEIITRRAEKQERVDIRTDLTPVAHLLAATKGSLPDWAPDGPVHVWLRVLIRERPYLVDVGDTPIRRVG